MSLNNFPWPAPNPHPYPVPPQFIQPINSWYKHYAIAPFAPDASPLTSLPAVTGIAFSLQQLFKKNKRWTVNGAWYQSVGSSLEPSAHGKNAGVMLHGSAVWSPARQGYVLCCFQGGARNGLCLQRKTDSGVCLLFNLYTNDIVSQSNHTADFSFHFVSRNI